MLFCHLRILFLSKLTVSEISFMEAFSVSNGLDPDQDQHSVGPDLDPTCLQMLSAIDKSPVAGKELTCVLNMQT